MTATHEAAAQRLLDKAAEAQTEYWDAVRALEEHLGIEIDGDKDLSEETVETLVGESVSGDDNVDED